MACAANYAWVNRSSMTFLCRQAFAKMFNSTPDDLDMHVVYDVSHNIAKVWVGWDGGGWGVCGWVEAPDHCAWWQSAGVTTACPAPAPSAAAPPRWRSTWWGASRGRCWCTARAPPAPSRRTTR